MKGICKLCGKSEELLNESHIIPDFIYRDLGIFNENHTLNRLTVKKEKEPIVHSRSIPSSEYEAGILCSKCDNEIIGGYENYAKKAMFGGALPSDESPIVTDYVTPQNIKYSQAVGISYPKFKLFLLSILWRMAISSRPIFYQVELSDEIKEKLRLMILNDDPGDLNEFPIYGMTYLNDPSMPRDIIGQPFRAEVDGNTIIRILLGGIFILYHISIGFHDENRIENLVLNKKNEWKLFHIEVGKGWEFFFKHASW
ncbi:MAG: hypothetical protein NTW10_05435 [Bacteroidetes bacterium]|nr:hypothetical protein [Bacteroidota bacterium]